MNIARIEINGVIAAVKELKPIPAGLIGGTVTFDFVDDVWKGLTKTVCFRGAVSKDIVDAEDIVIIPREVLAESARRIAVGVYGTDVNNNVAIPTLWAELGFTEYAADPSGDASTDPALPVWAQLQEEVAEANAIAKGRAKGYVFDTVEDLDLWLSDEAHTAELAVGDNFYIRALDVPDYWWDGTQKQPLETQKVELSGYVKNTDYATGEVPGLVCVPSILDGKFGFIQTNQKTRPGGFIPCKATDGDINAKTQQYRPIVPANLDYAVKRGVAYSAQTMTPAEKKAACKWIGTLNVVENSDNTITVTLPSGKTKTVDLSIIEIFT